MIYLKHDTLSESEVIFSRILFNTLIISSIIGTTSSSPNDYELKISFLNDILLEESSVEKGISY